MYIYSCHSYAVFGWMFYVGGLASGFALGVSTRVSQG